MMAQSEGDSMRGWSGALEQVIQLLHIQETVIQRTEHTPGRVRTWKHRKTVNQQNHQEPGKKSQIM